MQRGVRVVLLLVLLSFLALHAQPSEQRVEVGIGEQYTHIVTVVNTGAEPLTVSFRPSPFSEYLKDTANLSSSSVMLAPFESKNIQVTGVVPSLGPETHRLTYDVYAQEEKLDSFTILIPIKGYPQLHPEIKVDAHHAAAGSPLVLTLSLHNFGNVIAYYNISMAVVEGANVVESIKYPSLIQVLPGQERSVSLLSTQQYKIGTYDVHISALVNDNQLLEEQLTVEVNQSEEVLRVKKGDSAWVAYSAGDGIDVQYVLNREDILMLRGVAVVEDNGLTVPTESLEAGQYDLSLTPLDESLPPRSIRVVIESSTPRIMLALVVIVVLVAIFVWRLKRRVKP